ncbi:MAG TPA: aminotransferase class IV [Nocardioides sp.]|uniref:aminotransferase class IV n=1 Tax=Nocardioides sp. TaxID=35761 RepID=UPI002F42D8CC
MGDDHDLPDPTLGVFDTLLVRDGHPVALEAHVARLGRSVRELYGVPVEESALATRIGADAEGPGSARVRTSYDPTSGVWQVDVVPIEEPGLEPRTVALRRVRRGLGTHKWVDRRLVADPGAADDVLLVDSADQVLECGTANVIAVIGGTLVTPPLDGRILPGTVRDRVLDLLRSEDRAPGERPLSTAELASATEVFTTSSIRGVQPVVACPRVGAWPVGPWTTRLHDRMRTA